MALVNSSAQSQITQLTLRQAALAHYVAAARLSAFVKKSDLAEAASRLAWNAAIPVREGREQVPAGKTGKSGVVPSGPPPWSLSSSSL